MAVIDDAPPVRKPRRRRRNLLRLVAVVAAVFIVLNVGLTPWVFHIGGRFTPDTTWNGFGTVRATNGGVYVLFTHLQGGLFVSNRGHLACSQFSGCDNLKGSAKMCTRTGAMRTFSLRGTVHTWWSTDGAAASITLQPNPEKAMPDGFIFVFSGIWRGERLPVKNTDSSFTEVFRPDGTVRFVTSTQDAGTASVTLAAGTDAGFMAACHELAARSLR
jgi:hypothetical protein